MSVPATLELLSTLTDHALAQGAGRVCINAELMKSSKLFAGDPVVLLSESPDIRIAGIAWPSFDVPENGVQLSTPIASSAGVQPGQKLTLYPILQKRQQSSPIPSLKEIKVARSIYLREDGAAVSNDAKKQRDWLRLLLREILVDFKYITIGQRVKVVYERKTRCFIVSQATADEQDVAEALDSLTIDTIPIWIATWDSEIVIRSQKSVPERDTQKKKSQEDAYSSVGGLGRQITQIRDLLEIPLTRPELFKRFGLRPPRGILLHGPPGTGKTHLARAIATAANSSVIVVNGPELSSAYHGETESRLRSVFEDARRKSPCVVVLDEVDALVPRREEGGGGEVDKRVVATLLTILDGVESDEETNVIVVGTTNRPNAIDPALRRPGRFDIEIEIGVPDVEARLAILQLLLSKTPHDITPGELRTLSSRAHGYVGADLSAVVREAGTLAIKRFTAAPDGPLVLTLDDLTKALPTVRPSAMRSLFLDTPPVRYSDIGGQAQTIQKLKEAVEWPLKHPEAFKRLGVRPPKGVLLYGPPGNSKTVLARACAHESGVNFIAVKGPELLNKFVGESERAVRETFRKARAAAPSIVFFDEIDALGSSRSDTGTESSSHEGVLTMLLNEMDGVEELVGVTIIAATNRPGSIDPALLRPGRLDRLIYVSPPDQEGRKEILKIRMRKMSVAQDVDIEEIATAAAGCSGAEITAICQEAALLIMKEDINAEYVPHRTFVVAAHSMKRQTTPAVTAFFEKWANSQNQK